jgi:phytoene desaturase
MKRRALVVGGGLGGLSAAICLAAKGWRATVLEQEGQIGGKMGEIREAGYRWDTGPTVITLRHVLDGLFQAAGRRMEDYLELVPIDPLTRYHYPDGTVLDIHASLARTVADIEAMDESDVDGYLAYLSYAARMYRITAPVILYQDPPSLRSVLGLPIRDMMRVDFRRTMDRAIGAHVRSPYLRQLFDRYATYLGASPFKARAFLNVIAHVELTAGLWYPRGGTYGIAQAYRRLAIELGVEVRTQARVRRVLVEGDQAVGVELADGAVERGDAVIAGVDATTVYHDLLPKGAAIEARRSRRLRRWVKRPFSCSGFVLYLGVERRHPQLTHHNIFFTPDYRAEFGAIFDRGVPHPEPTIYVAITAKTDPDHAPEGGENWYVMTNVPPSSAEGSRANTSRWDWEREAQGYRDRVLERLASLGLDVRDHIRAERMLTPLDIERKTGAWRGALYGHSFNNWLASFQRPHNRSPDVRGLYFAGGTAHPGGGVPMVTLSGKTAARLLLRDYGE